MRTSPGSATKINLKPLGERAARPLEQVKAMPVHPEADFYLASILTSETRPPLCALAHAALLLPRSWGAVCLRLAVLSRSDPACAQGREDALQSSVLLNKESLP